VGQLIGDGQLHLSDLARQIKRIEREVWQRQQLGWLVRGS
jgi:hypothetical protein